MIELQARELGLDKLAREVSLPTGRTVAAKFLGINKLRPEYRIVLRRILRWLAIVKTSARAIPKAFCI